MSMDRTDLDELLAVIEEFAGKFLAGSDKVDLALMQATPLPTLVSELLEAEIPHALAWTFEVVEAVAKRSAAWGYVLASRYTAQFAAKDISGLSVESFVAVGVRTNEEFTVMAAPLAAGPMDSLIVLAGDSVFGLEEVARSPEQPQRTGLAGAQLTQVAGNIQSTAKRTDVGTDAWSVLLGAVICGLGSALVQQSVAYTEQREQFGAPIASFPGLRAVIGTTSAEVMRSRALLHSHAVGEATTVLADALSSVGDAVVQCAIDAVQSMGGYGYIDEFPVAGMFRDAISLRARSTSALSAWRASAEFAYDKAR